MVIDYFGILLWLVTTCIFLATLRRILFRYKPIEFNNQIWKIISAPWWLMTLIVLVPWLTGAFARGEESFLPWVGFNEALLRYNFLEAYLHTLLVLTVEIWIFFGVAEEIVRHNERTISNAERVYKITNEEDPNSEESKKEKEHIQSLKDKYNSSKKFYYVINLLIGIFLVSKYNFIYKLIEFIGSVTGVGY